MLARPAAQLRLYDWGYNGWNQLQNQPVGINLASQRHWLSTLREAATKEQRIGLHSQRESGLFLQEFRSLFGARTEECSPLWFQTTEEALFAEEIPLQACGTLYTEG